VALQIHAFLTATIEVSGQLRTTAILHPGKKAHGTHWIGGWVGPRADLDTAV